MDIKEAMAMDAWQEYERILYEEPEKSYALGLAVASVVGAKAAAPEKLEKMLGIAKKICSDDEYRIVRIIAEGIPVEVISNEALEHAASVIECNVNLAKLLKASTAA